MTMKKTGERDSVYGDRDNTWEYSPATFPLHTDELVIGLDVGTDAGEAARSRGPTPQDDIVPAWELLIAYVTCLIQHRHTQPDSGEELSFFMSACYYCWSNHPSGDRRGSKRRNTQIKIENRKLFLLGSPFGWGCGP